MGNHMKTTIDLTDYLFYAAKAQAEQTKTTLRALIEEGLRRVLQDQPTKKNFKLKDARVKGGKILVSNPKAWLDEETLYLANHIKP
jgi:hypothetical protein